MTYVIKATGEKQKFNPTKIKQSILNAGASKELANKITNKIKTKAYNNISTKKILNLTLKSLKKDRGTLARYDLKRAIMQLGPSGFPFEKYFTLILNHNKYNAKDGGILKGKNITHEIDIIAKKNKTSYLIECKYHNQLGTHTKVKVPLYVYARFLDLKKHFNTSWLATNTKCTPDVINYAKGINMRITSWDYPEEHSLRTLITEENLYPITVLKDINQKAKEKLFESGIFLIKTLTEINPKKLKNKTGFSERYIDKIINEARTILV